MLLFKRVVFVASVFIASKTLAHRTSDEAVKVPEDLIAIGIEAIREVDSSISADDILGHLNNPLPKPVVVPPMVEILNIQARDYRAEPWFASRVRPPVEFDFMNAIRGEDYEMATRLFNVNAINPDARMDRHQAQFIQGTPLLWAAAKGQWALVARMLELYPTADINASFEEGPYRGITVLWLAANQGQWGQVARMLELNPRALINATPAEVDPGVTVLWIAVNQHQWDLVSVMLEANPGLADLNAGHARGPDRGKTVLWMTAAEKQWALVARMLELNPAADINAAPVEGPSRGITVFFYAANCEQWALVSRMLELNPRADIDATPAEEGNGRGITALWSAARGEQWVLVGRMLELNPSADINASPVEGPNRGKTALWLAACYNQWALVALMLELNPGADINASPVEGVRRGETVLWLATHEAWLAGLDRATMIYREANAPQWATVAHIALRYPMADFNAAWLNPERTVQFIIEKDAPTWVKTLLKMVRMLHSKEPSPEFINAFLGFLAPSALSNIKELPKEIRYRLAENAIIQHLPELGDVPPQLRKDVTKLLRSILLIAESLPFEVLDAARLLSKEPNEVATRVLNALASIHERRALEKGMRLKVVSAIQWCMQVMFLGGVDSSNGFNAFLASEYEERLKAVRGWIMDEIRQAVESAEFPPSLSEPVRARLVEMLNARTVENITREWIRETIGSFQKESLSSVEVMENQQNDAALRAELTREVIAGAPLLDRAQIANNNLPRTPEEIVNQELNNSPRHLPWGSMGSNGQL